MDDPGGLVILIAMAGGVALSVCVAPVMTVVAALKHGEVALGQAVSIQVEPIGEIAEFEGTETLYAPLLFIKPVTVELSVPPVQVYGPTGNEGFGTNVKVKLPPFQDCAPASVTCPETVVDCAKALTAPASRKAKAKMILFIVPFSSIA